MKPEKRNRNLSNEFLDSYIAPVLKKVVLMKYNYIVCHEPKQDFAEMAWMLSLIEIIYKRVRINFSLSSRRKAIEIGSTTGFIVNLSESMLV